MSTIWRLTSRKRFRWLYSNPFLILSFFLLICYLIINERYRRNYLKFDKKENIPSIIRRIQDIPIINQKYQFNIAHQISIDDIPSWINRYKISHLFNFYWLQTGGYKWHLQQMLDLKHISKNRPIYSHNRTHLLDYLHHHPEYGVIIDTTPDPFQPLFPPLPQTSTPLKEICAHLGLSNHWYPCFQRRSRSSFKPLITYGLYNVIIGNSSAKIHYDEIIYLFDDQFDKLNETLFVTQILPRFIRLLALVPQTAVILSPYFNSKIKYVNQYIDILIQREILNDRKRLIKYHPEKNYHAYVVYSTSSPRSDLIILNYILMRNQSSIQREFILIIRNNLDQEKYDAIVKIINQFELPVNLNHLRIREYNEKSYSIKQISQLFSQAMIVISMPSHALSHIVWCSPGTQIIEIGQRTMTTEYYEISLQLNFDYWLTLTTKTNQIDLIDFRHLMLKVFTHLND